VALFSVRVDDFVCRLANSASKLFTTPRIFLGQLPGRSAALSPSSISGAADPRVEQTLALIKTLIDTLLPEASEQYLRGRYRR
jgi:hypothetical protein